MQPRDGLVYAHPRKGTFPGMPLIADTPPREVIAHSQRGRDVVARRIGSAGAPSRILVVGAIHGNERAGVPVLRALRSAKPPRGVQIVLVDPVNPDGDARNARQNARGVDLNRNWPVGWHGGGRAFGTYFAGTAPLSEPETAAWPPTSAGCARGRRCTTTSTCAWWTAQGAIRS